MLTEPFARALRRSLAAAAGRLGAADPSPVLGEVLDCSFPLPAGDPRYARNALAPGFLPFEFSFSERAPGTLRFDFEPMHPRATAAQRLAQSEHALRSVIKRHFGAAARSRFDLLAGDCRAACERAEPTFGAFIGAVFDAAGLREAKIYYELDRNCAEALPERLMMMAREAHRAVPGLRPLLLSMACTRAGAGARLYFMCDRGLRLLDLQPLLERSGLAHRLPDLISNVLDLTGGELQLPPDSAVLSLKQLPYDIDVKVELLRCALPCVYERQLASRPDSLRAFRDWMRGVPKSEVSVVSVGVTGETAARLTMYCALPVGFEDCIDASAISR